MTKPTKTDRKMTKNDQKQPRIGKIDKKMTNEEQTTNKEGEKNCEKATKNDQIWPKPQQSVQKYWPKMPKLTKNDQNWPSESKNWPKNDQ